jgi:exodeoxyribonuclease III
MRIISLNVNGIRSACNKGLGDWLPKVRHLTGPTLLCVQEVKAQLDDLSPAIKQLAGLNGYFHLAQKKGYSGVALYSSHVPSAVIYGFGSAEFDAEGRYVELRFDKPSDANGQSDANGGQKLSVLSVYFPSGSSGEERQAAKFRFLAAFLPHLQALVSEPGREVILCGDVNIAHKEIDLKNWKSNQKNSGFLPEERAWLSGLLATGWVDVFRTLNQQAEQYTWWSNRGQAYAKNVGWRIDYHLATPGIAARAQREHIYTTERFSDHAPLVIDYDYV